MEIIYNLPLIITLSFILLILGTFAWGGILAAPWVPLWKRDVKRMLDLANIKPGEKLYDLGAGDGRIIIIAAKNHQAKAVGFEIATLPYLIGYIKILLAGLRGQARLKYSNFYKADLSDADIICMFLTPSAMKKLKPKFEQELKAGCRVLSYAFHIPGWTETKKDKPNEKTTAIYVYQVGTGY